MNISMTLHMKMQVTLHMNMHTNMHMKMPMTRHMNQHTILISPF